MFQPMGGFIKPGRSYAYHAYLRLLKNTGPNLSLFAWRGVDANRQSTAPEVNVLTTELSVPLR